MTSTLPPTVERSTGPRLPRRALEAVDERLGLKALQYPVPEHANNLGWSLGGLTATALLVLIATGLVLTQYFNPMPEDANQSVRRIVTDVPLGSFVRGIHFWAAQAMYVLAGLHLLRVLFSASYKRPREANWLVGVAMFALVIGAIFTGTVMKWDQEGFEALAHNLEVGRLLGGVGFWFSAEFSGDLPLIVRLYVAHVAIIPLVLLGGLGLLAVLFPPGVGPTPVEGIEVTRPLWMFWWLFTLENWFGLKGILWGTIGLFSILAAVPFLDRRPERRWQRRPVAIGLGALILVAMVVLTLVTAFTDAAEHLG